MRVVRSLEACLSKPLKCWTLSKYTMEILVGAYVIRHLQKPTVMMWSLSSLNFPVRGNPSYITLFPQRLRDHRCCSSIHLICLHHGAESSSSSFYWASLANAPNVLQPYWLIVLHLDLPALLLWGPSGQRWSCLWTILFSNAPNFCY